MTNGQYEEIVRAAVAPLVGDAEIEGVRVTSHDDDNDLWVTVEVGLTSPLPPDLLLRITDAGSEAIEATGEARFPVVFGDFAEAQEFAAA